MKRASLLLVLFAVILSSCGSPKTARQFYNKHKRKEGVTNASIPGWLVWLGTGLAYHSVDNDEAKMGLKLAKKVKRLRFMKAEDRDVISKEEVNTFLTNLRSNKYEDLIMIRDHDQTVSVMIRDTETKIKNIMILVDQEDEFVFLSMKSRIKYKDLSDLINYYINDFKGEEPEKKKKKKKEKDPQA